MDFVGAKLFPWQKAFVDLIDNNPGDSIFVQKSRRQIGKSLLLENLLLQHSLNWGRQDSVMVSPTYKQCGKIFREIVRAVAGTPVLKSANASELLLTFINGSTVQFLSAEAKENLRGYTVTKHGLLCIDEAAYINDEAIHACLPFVDANKASIVLTSTPLFKSGFFYDMFVAGINGESNCFCVDVNDYDTSALLSPEKLEFYRKTLPTNIFMTDYLGQFIDAKGTVFGDFSPVLSKLIPPGPCEAMGVDWATGTNNDETVFVLFNKDNQMMRLEHFNDKDSTETIEMLVGLVRQYKPKRLTVEMNSIGQVYFDMLKKELKKNHISTQVIEFNTTNDSKRKVVENLQVLINQHQISLLDDPVLKLQFAAFETKKTPTGKITYGNSSDRVHDDIVMATALALYSKGGSYLIV